MHNHFNTVAKESISYSAEEARRTNSPAITAAHLLLGLLRVEDESITRLRTNLGARLTDFTAAVETKIPSAGQDDTSPWRIPLDREAERIIRHSTKEVSGRKQEIEPRHLMLAIIHDKDSTLTPVLQQFGIPDNF